jgi:hypothetical protein
MNIHEYLEYLEYFFDTLPLDTALLLHESPPLFDPDPADPALLLVNCVACVILPCQDLHESSSTTGTGAAPP